MDMPALSRAADLDRRHHLHPYTQLRQLEREGPLVIVRGEGVHVYDEQGHRYLEGMARLWCASLGFSERLLTEAAYRQMQTLPYYHTFSGKVPGPVTELVEKMIALAPVPMARLLFANSGSEANDTTFKLVRCYHNAIGKPAKKKVIARQRAYRGVTMAAASLSGLPIMHKHFDLPLPGVVRVSDPHGYSGAAPGESETQFVDRLIRELEDTLAREGPETIAAFIAEPVQGAGGVPSRQPRPTSAVSRHRSAGSQRRLALPVHGVQPAQSFASIVSDGTRSPGGVSPGVPIRPRSVACTRFAPMSPCGESSRAWR
jgi:4-aminobutyrate--pyruvate transaminase